MKGSISDQVKIIVDKSPVIKEMLVKNLLNCSNYAKIIIKNIKGDSEITESSVIMALRRYALEIKKTKNNEEFKNLKYQITIHTGIIDINLYKNEEVFKKLVALFPSLSTKRGNFINLVVGTNEFSVIFSENYKDDVLKIVSDSHVIHFGEDLVAFTLVFTGKFMQTPGIIYEIARRMAWDGINVYEIVSTLNELTFVVGKNDSLVTYEVIQSFNFQEENY
ncbi:MAG: hypothetical protein WC162_01145 [Sphaerochaetaceae bacterium]|nr:hypothetical protein [Sphaerochaetaceae bacterium]